jgi:sugar phosphate isomerase/epimerase
MNQIKTACPLYILREEAGRDLTAVLEKIRSLGFDGVEFIGLFGRSPEAVRREIDRLSLRALGDHVQVDDFMADPDGVIASHKTLGCEYISIGVPHDLTFGSPELPGIIEKIKSLSRLCVKNGITPLYHNHGFEYLGEFSVADKILDDCVGEGLRFEPDLGWMALMGADPAVSLVKYKDRCPVIHLKDFYAADLSKAQAGAEPGDQKALPEKGYFEFRPVGYGIVNMPRLMPLCLDCQPQWIVMDHDIAYDRSPYDDLKLSLDYTRQLFKLQ